MRAVRRIRRAGITLAPSPVIQDRTYTVHVQAPETSCGTTPGFPRAAFWAEFVHLFAPAVLGFPGPEGRPHPSHRGGSFDRRWAFAVWLYPDRTSTGGRDDRQRDVRGRERWLLTEQRQQASLAGSSTAELPTLADPGLPGSQVRLRLNPCALLRRRSAAELSPQRVERLF